MMSLVVVENTRRWPHYLSGVQVISARSYLIDASFSDLRGVTVFNLCRTYAYQSVGYYVSLLGAARGHRPLPSVETIQDLRLSPLLRIVSEELDELIQRSLAPLKSPRFELSIYFGRNVTERYDRLSQALFNQFPAPFLRVTFECDDRWSLSGVRTIATSEIPDSHRDFVIERATAYFGRPRRPARQKQKYRYDLAILVNPKEEEAPSDDRAIRKFVRAARELDINATEIERDDYGRLAEFDALFIRETTRVNHYTYRFARRAAAHGLVVMDDPDSIIKCTNKVFQAELFARHRIPSPKTMVVQRDTIDEVAQRIGLPCILKQPDSSFSQGVVKVTDPDDLRRQLLSLLEDSELVIAQAYVISSFDWRIGVLDGKPLYACKYYLARGDWRIMHTDAKGRRRYGATDTLPFDQVPSDVIDVATRSARLIGNGLYGVDLKQINGRVMVIEVNDNPTIEAGGEDRVIEDELYLAVMRHFRNRLDARGARSRR
jgi:glutathione synthase/RimK-type ligase-like ATP-grasp enzyme